MKIGRKRRWGLYATCTTLWLSGVVYWLLARAAETPDGLSPALSAWKPRLLALHGAGAMFFLILFGALLPRHVLPGWRLGTSRRTGALTVALGTLLAVTGWLLYYAGDETLRTGSARIHDGIGLALPAILAVHIIRGRRGRFGPS